MKCTHLTALCACLNIGAAVLADTPAHRTTDPARAGFGELAAFFSGRWQCSGHFTNGKAISARESFNPVLDGKWLLQIHDDDPPFQYHAYSFWGVDSRSGDLLITIHDVTGSVRLFRSSTWRSPSFVLDAAPMLGNPPSRERFTYQRESAGLFSFAYAIRRDSGDWQEVDRSECRRAAAEPR